MLTLVCSLAACADPAPVDDGSDPAFAGEAAAIGWAPIDLTSDLATAGDGDDPGDPGDLDEDDLAARVIGRDAWGGLAGSGLPTTATGFFHLERPAGAERAWLVDPDGNPFWAVGVNTVLRSANAPDIDAYLRRLPDFARVAALEWDRLSTGAAGGFGYGFNNVGSFSETNDLDGSRPSPIVALAPYGIRLSTAASATAPYALRSAGGQILGADDSTQTLGDPFNPAFAAELRARWATEVRPADRNLLYYWLDNETGMFDHPLHFADGVRDLRRWMWSQCPAGSTVDAPRCAPHALARFLRDRYGTVARLEAAWGHAAGGSFLAAVERRPVPGASDSTHRCERACADDLQRFNRVLIREWIKVTTGTLRALDGNHLVSSPRLMVADAASFCFWGASCAERFTHGPALPGGTVPYAPWPLFRRNGPYGFDLVSINIYSRADHRGFEEPWLRAGLHAIQAESGLPILISEFGIRARIDGWSNSGGAPAFVPRSTPAGEQATRGDYYAHDLERFMAFRGVVGASFHRWADRFTSDSQMNMGIVHRDGARWDGFDASIRHVNRGLYGRLRRATGW